MDTVNLIYRIDGDHQKINQGINVFDLAPVLLSMGQLINETNKILFPGGRKLSVNVKPFQDGSFIIDILIYTQDHYQAIIDVFAHRGIHQVKEVLETIGLSLKHIGEAAGGIISVISLIKAMKGVPHSVEKISQDQYKYTNKNNESYLVPNKVHMVFNNCEFKTPVFDALVRPTEIDGVEKVETYLKNEEGGRVVFDKNVASSIKRYVQGKVFTPEEDDFIETTIEAYIQPKRGGFDGDGKRWIFFLGNAKITANITDEAFIKKCQNGEIRPYVGDIMRVKILQRMKKTDPKICSFEVIKVIDYKHSEKPVQYEMSV